MKLGGAGEAYFDEIAEDEGEQIFDAVGSPLDAMNMHYIL